MKAFSLLLMMCVVIVPCGDAYAQATGGIAGQGSSAGNESDGTSRQVPSTISPGRSAPPLAGHGTTPLGVAPGVLPGQTPSGSHDDGR